MRNLIPELHDKRILIAPLCWGLGHATRSLPLIKHYAKSNDVEVASDGIALEWLRKELPNVEMHHLPSYNIRYDKRPSIGAHLSMSKNVKKAISEEFRVTKRLVTERKFDFIISDHRLGVRDERTTSIILAHQLTIPYRSFLWRKASSIAHRYYLNQFDMCWVPDYPCQDQRLSGEMSDLDLNIPKQYIGPLSRYSKSSARSPDIDLLVILSGVEPDRSNLEERLYELLMHASELSIAIVRGTTNVSSRLSPNMNGVEVIDLADSQILEELISRAKVVLSRPGYSTLMDLHMMKKPAILIPCEHQPEQLYLSEQFSMNMGYTGIREGDLTQETLFTEVNRLAQSSK